VRLIGVGTFLVAILASHLSAWAYSDSEISEMLLGSWDTAPDSADAQSDTISLEVFHKDGTYTVDVYSDRICGNLVQSLKATWKVRDGALISIDKRDGRLIIDEIAKINPMTMTLHSLDDGTINTRMRVPTCRGSAN
jgi:hypothetical protein